MAKNEVIEILRLYVNLLKKIGECLLESLFVWQLFE